PLGLGAPSAPVSGNRISRISRDLSSMNKRGSDHALPAPALFHTIRASIRDHTLFTSAESSSHEWSASSTRWSKRRSHEGSFCREVVALTRPALSAHEQSRSTICCLGSGDGA